MVIINGDTNESSSDANTRAASAATGVHHSANNNARGAAFSSTRLRPPPPFLLKVYSMVQDPNTDSIISWNAEGTSFIILDPHRLAGEVLSQNFRHDNLSSFRCQLNTYCFKQISWDRLEYQNEWFQRGKEHLLRNIKRRNSNVQSLHEGEDGMEESEITEEIEDLRQESDALMAETKELKEWHKTVEKQIAVLTEQAECNESKLKKMVRLMKKVVQMLKEELRGTEVAKKRRLEGPQIESLMKLRDTEETSDKRRVGNIPTAQTDKKDVLWKSAVRALTILNVGSSEFALLEKQLMEDFKCKNVPKEEMSNLQPSMIELEDLMAGPAEWEEYYTLELLGKAKNMKADT